MSTVYARARPYPLRQRLDVYAGDGVEFTLTTDWDLNAGGVYGEVRRERGDPEPLQAFYVNVEGEGSNVARVGLTGTQTAELGAFVGVYDVQAVGPDGEPVTLVQGPMFCARDVSRGTDPTPPPPFDPGYPILSASFGPDGPMAPPWTPIDLLYPGAVPDVASDAVIGSPFAGYAVMQRADLAPAAFVGIHLETDWTTSASNPSLKLFLIENDTAWLEFRYSWTGSIFEAEIVRITVAGEDVVSTTLVPVHEAPILPDGGLLAFMFGDDTIRYLTAASGDSADLTEAASNMGLVAPATWQPAFQISSDAGVSGFIYGIPDD